MSGPLASQHPRLVAALAQHVKGWAGDVEHLADAWIAEALDAFHDGRDYEVAGRYTINGRPVMLNDSLVDVFLSRAEVAERIGVAASTLSRYVLPVADATIGNVRGWRASTIDAWNSTRPGRGYWRK